MSKAIIHCRAPQVNARDLQAFIYLPNSSRSDHKIPPVLSFDSGFCGIFCFLGVYETAGGNNSLTTFCEVSYEAIQG